TNSAHWTGSDCEIPICFSKSSADSKVCSGHGECISPNNCSCVDGYSGDDCSVVILRKDENPEFNPSCLWFLLLLIIPAIAIGGINISIIVILKRKKTVQKEKDKQKASTELENIKIAQMTESFKPIPFLLESSLTQHYITIYLSPAVNYSHKF